MKSRSIIQVIILTCLMCASQAHAQQESLNTLTKSWQDLKVQLVKRADIALKIVAVLEKTDSVDIEMLDTLYAAAQSLKYFLKTTTSFEQFTIQKTYHLNNDLIKSLSLSLIFFKGIEKFKPAPELENLRYELAGIENRIHLASRIYNDWCISYDRKDLTYGIQKN